MSLLPDAASFEERVQECFLAHRGAGLMLSPLDVELLMRWGETGAPYEVVARGIRKAAERAVWDARPGEPALRSLRGCRKEVEAELRKWQARAAGATARPAGGKQPRSLEEERWRKARASVEKLCTLQPFLQDAGQRLLLGPLAVPAADLPGADRVEEGLYLALVRALPFSRRLALYREASLQAGCDLQGSARARKLSLRFHRQAMVRRALELPAFW